MRPTTTTRLLALFCLSLLPGTLAACGNGVATTSGIASTPVTTVGTTTQTSSPRRLDSRARPERTSSKQPASSQTPSGPAPTDAAPLPNQGTGAVAPGVPTVKNGDNSIQAYGVEADAALRVTATKLIVSFFGDEASGDWGAACGMLRAQVASNLAELSRHAPASKGRGCPVALRALLLKLPQSEQGRGDDLRVLSLRVKGPQAFVIYRDANGKAYNMPLRREDGQWKIAALVGVALSLEGES